MTSVVGVGGAEAESSYVVGKLERTGPLVAVMQQVRFTPFGQGLVTISHGFGEVRSTPQTLHLWSIAAMMSNTGRSSGSGGERKTTPDR
jgi:hypothetical protein